MPHKEIPPCCIKGCDAPGVCGGLCYTHHRRNVRYGSPIATKNAAWRWLRLSDGQRFWIQVEKTETCWLWKGGLDKDGYPLFKASIDGVTHTRGHRYSYHLHKGRIPFSLSVCHSCDTPACIRPDHFFLGTNRQNHADKMAKGRQRGPGQGEKHFAAKLTERQAKAILLDARPHSWIANEYGVTTGTVSDIKCRRSWGHLGDAPGVKAPRVSPRKGISDKITPDIVRRIRTATERGTALAAELGVTKATITDIRKRRSWAHVE
jgi:hypothetical protein